jgi:hypothetical protein
MPKGVPGHLISHGWRAGVDGDGRVAMSKGSGSRLPQGIIALTGDWGFVVAWQSFIRKRVPTTADIQPNHNIWKFTVIDSYAITVGQLLYKNAPSHSQELCRACRSLGKPDSGCAAGTSRPVRASQRTTISKFTVDGDNCGDVSSGRRFPTSVTGRCDI